MSNQLFLVSPGLKSALLAFAAINSFKFIELVGFAPTSFFMGVPCE